MKIVVLGATGGTGLEIVRQAVERGHKITAFVRRLDALEKFGDRIAVICGNLFPGVVQDATEMEKVFQKSELDWTIVRPPQLTNKPRSGKYRALVGHLPPFGFKISRADVADFIVKAGENHASVGKIVGISS